MLFSSVEFLFYFLPIVLFLYYSIGRFWPEGRNLMLVGASLFFYGFWKPIYLPLIVVSTLINFCLGRLISIEHDAWHKKLFLVVGVLLNVSLLGVFKYTDFFILNVNTLSGLDIQPLGLLLPLAISFFTFQQIAYLVDAYRGDAKDYKLLDYFLFVTFFPQLIAGPIVHHRGMMSQFSSKASSLLNFNNISVGIVVFSIGLFKKLVVADHFGVYADLGYGNVEALDFYGAWSTSLAYTVQLYYDFSGYCDMAIGAALLFNIKLPVNFNSPYKALNIQDFWRRWHITLSTWLRDYIYIPIGGSRGGSWRTYSNLIITFLIGGFWHGAGWGFVFWGLMHGAGLAIHRFWRLLGLRMPVFLAWLATFLFVHFSWVLFRADNVTDAFGMYELMLNSDFEVSFPSLLQAFYLGGVSQLNGAYVIACSLLFVFFAARLNNSMVVAESYSARPLRVAMLAGAALVLSVVVMLGSSTQTFLYFNF